MCKIPHSGVITYLEALISSIHLSKSRLSKIIISSDSFSLENWSLSIMEYVSNIFLNLNLVDSSDVK